MPAGQESFLELNEELSAIWPVIAASKPPPEDAVEWDGVEGKLEHLER
jgi:ferredoxin